MKSIDELRSESIKGLALSTEPTVKAFRAGKDIHLYYDCMLYVNYIGSISILQYCQFLWYRLIKRFSLIL